MNQPMNRDLHIGGQAVIEGVMMRSPQRMAIAVRNHQGGISLKREELSSLTAKGGFWGWPLVRGAVVLVETLIIGIRALNWSAEIAMEEGREKRDRKHGEKTGEAWAKLGTGLMTVFAFALGLIIFMYIPYWLSRALKEAGQNQFVFHLIAGAIRMLFFLGYLYLISRWKEIRRIFEYHGAEHKSIFALEAGENLSPQSVAKYGTHHPRCGTSFILIVAVLAILFFALFDSVVVSVVGDYPNVGVRFLVHLPLIPLVAGISYEVLKLSGEKRKSRLVALLSQPGLWLQKITTLEPDEEQLEVALAALNAVLEK